MFAVILSRADGEGSHDRPTVCDLLRGPSHALGMTSGSE